MTWILLAEAALLVFWFGLMPFVMWAVWIRRGRPRVLPPHLSARPHEDYKFWPFNRVPREATAFRWGAPRMLWGNQTNFDAVYDSVPHRMAPKPIPEAGAWQVSCFPALGPVLGRIPCYFAVTLKNGWHFRDGIRWDNVDGYSQFPSIAIRKYAGGDSQDTSVK